MIILIIDAVNCIFGRDQHTLINKHLCLTAGINHCWQRVAKVGAFDYPCATLTTKRPEITFHSWDNIYYSNDFSWWNNR